VSTYTAKSARYLQLGLQLDSLPAQVNLHTDRRVPKEATDCALGEVVYRATGACPRKTVILP